jgi:hypothetical protein
MSSKPGDDIYFFLNEPDARSLQAVYRLIAFSYHITCSLYKPYHDKHRVLSTLDEKYLFGFCDLADWLLLESDTHDN